MTARRPVALAMPIAFAILMSCLPGPARAGTIALAWDPVPDAAFYRIQITPDGPGDVQTVDVPAGETSHLVDVVDAADVRVCVWTVDAEAAVSDECSNEIVGWPAPRIDGVESVSAEFDGSTGGVVLGLRLDGANFHPDGGLLVDDPAVAVIGQDRSTTGRVDVTLRLPAGVTRLDRLTLQLFNDHPLDSVCAATGVTPGLGCPADAVAVAIDVEAVVGGLFSIAANRYTTSGPLFHQRPYAVPVPGEPVVAATPSFLPASASLVALDLEPDGTVLFAVGAATPLGTPSMTLFPSAVYARRPDGAISLAHDFGSGGPGLAGVGAASRLADGRWLVVPAVTTTVQDGGASRTLASSSVYRYDPTSGAIDELFNGGALGTGRLDAVDGLADGRIVFSTAAHPYVWTGGSLLRLWGMNGYAIDPQSFTIETVLDGQALGLVDLDALSLGASVGASVEQVEPVEAPPASARPRWSSTTNGYAGWGQYFHQRVYEAAADGSSAVAVVPSFLPSTVGLDALDENPDGTFYFSVGPGGAVSTASGVTTLFPGAIYHTSADGTVSVPADPFGGGLAPSDIDALDVRPDGSVWFSTASNEWLSIAGVTRQLSHARVYVWSPGAEDVEVVFDLSARGVHDLDAVTALDDGRIVFSTASSPFVTVDGGSRRLWSMNAWVWNPADDSIELWLDGAALGLANLDAVTLEP